MSEDRLQAIQSLQFTARGRAETLLLRLLREVFPLDIVHVRLRPLAVSLNSFNGTLTLASGERLFFKSHTESDSVLREYYQAAALEEAGWPVIRPLHSSTARGRQLLLYELVDDPSVFDVARAIERGDGQSWAALVAAQHAADDELLRLYIRSLAWQTEAEAAGVHQLFWHRLTGGRCARFYGAHARFMLPQGALPADDVLGARWTINGQEYRESLAELVARAETLLRPSRPGPAVAGHGDAHNGNLFLRENGRRMVYFDPAFAGRHHPLLDLAKPLYHNVFAMWMYFPQEAAAEISIELHADAAGRWHVRHDWSLNPVRTMFLESKLERVLLPTLAELRARGWLRADWRAYLKAALFCCPLLTMNLADGARFPAPVSLLGLAQAMEMGAESAGERSPIDRALDSVAIQLESGSSSARSSRARVGELPRKT